MERTTKPKFERAVDQIEQLITEGFSVAAACRTAGISSQTYYRNSRTAPKELKKRSMHRHKEIRSDQ
jgi:DNA invertase Pin-like site-specific DNA recombinase